MCFAFAHKWIQPLFYKYCVENVPTILTVLLCWLLISFIAFSSDEKIVKVNIDLSN